MNNSVSEKFVFYDLSTNEIILPKYLNVVDGEIDSVSTDDKTYNKNEFVYTNLVLHIPGMGDALCGEMITIQHPRELPKTYILNYGWHKNNSNQILCTWYLVDISDKKTLKNQIKGVSEMLTDEVLGDGFTKRSIPDTFVSAKTLDYDDFTDVIAITNLLPTVLPADISH